jgi:hypothetical protein
MVMEYTGSERMSTNKCPHTPSYSLYETTIRRLSENPLKKVRVSENDKPAARGKARLGPGVGLGRLRGITTQAIIMS